jgi:hypothetical protein
LCEARRAALVRGFGFTVRDTEVPEEAESKLPVDVLLRVVSGSAGMTMTCWVGSMSVGEVAMSCWTVISNSAE